MWRTEKRGERIARASHDAPARRRRRRARAAVIGEIIKPALLDAEATATDGPMVVAWSTPPPSLAISLALKFDFPTTSVYCSSVAHWHAQNFEREKKIKGAGLRSSTLFVHLVCDGGHMPMPFAKAKKKWPIWDLDSATVSWR